MVLGNNRAAQIHADNSADGCFSGHWGMDGTKSGMRYNLAGGYQYSVESSSGYRYCVGVNYGSLDAKLRETIEGLTRSSAHNQLILDPYHRKVNLGITRTVTGLLWVVQQFEGDYITYSQFPKFDGMELSLSGVTKNNAGFDDGKSLKVDIYYDPPAKTLTRGQLSMSYCEDSGLLVASLLPPAPPGYSYTDLPETFSFSYQRCNSPYDVPGDTLSATSDAEQVARDALSRVNNPFNYSTAVNWIVASDWQADGTKFAVKADVGKILEKHGKGIYTLTVWADLGGKLVPISKVSLFHGIPRPPGYD